MSTKSDSILLHFLVAILVIGSATFILYLNIQRPYLSYPQLPLRISLDSNGNKNTFKVGDSVILDVPRNNASSSVRVYITSRKLVRLDKRQKDILLPAVGASVDPGFSEIKSALTTVPNKTEPGTYIIVGISEIPARFRDPFIVTWQSESFQIVQ